MIYQRSQRATRTDRGFSLIEVLIVLVVAGIMTAVAIPQMAQQRRLMRSNALAREVMTQLRYTRQLAMSERQAFTFQYDNVNKQMLIIDHNNLQTDPNSGKAVLSALGYPFTTGSKVISTVPLTQGGLTTGEISYGIPSTFPSTAKGALDDGISMTALASNVVNITFQRDGTVINSSGTATDRNAQDSALFFYNPLVSQWTAFGVSVLGASGRVKIWRYDNATKYVE